jgi:hypothetical protein
MMIAVKHHSALKGAIGMGHNWHGNCEEKGAIGMKMVKRSPFLILVMYPHQYYDLTEASKFLAIKNLILSHTFIHDIILATKNLP